METIWPKNHMDYVNYIIQYVMFFLATALVHSNFEKCKTHHNTAWNRNQKIPNPQVGGSNPPRRTIFLCFF